MRTVMSTLEATPPAATADPRGNIDKNRLMEAMQTVDSDEALRKAFDILSSKSGKSKGHVSADVIRDAMQILGVYLQVEEIDGIIRKEARAENDEMINREGFIRTTKNIWKIMADSMINGIAKVIDEFIPNKAELDNIRREFPNGLKDIWKSVADPKIHEAEKEIDELISKKAEQENDGNTHREFINSVSDIWKRMADSMIHEVEKKIDEYNPKEDGLENDGNIHSWFINSLKHLWKRVVDSTINEEGKAIIDEFISNKTELENYGNISNEFISNLIDIAKRVDDSMITEKVGSEEVLLMVHAMVLAERLGSNASAALLRCLIPFLGCNLADEEIIADIKSNIEDDGRINREEFIQIIR